MNRVGPIGVAWVAGRPAADVVIPYSVTGPHGSAWGVLCLADAGEPASTEDTDPAVVAAWSAELARTRVLRSAVLLVPMDGEDRLTPVVQETVAGREPVSSTVDERGQRHRLWLEGPGARSSAILAVAGAHPLLVADGNHRTAAVRKAGLPSLLAMVTAGPDLRIGPIHRELVDSGLDGPALAAAWDDAGLDVDADVEPDPPAKPGSVTAVTEDMALTVRLPPVRPDEPVPRIDHAAVEDVLLQEALGVDPAGPGVRALPVDRPPQDRRGDAVLLIPPVPIDDVLEVQRQGRRMPRKSSCFVPKPKDGLVHARLDVPGFGQG